MKKVYLVGQYVPAIKKSFENKGYKVIQGSEEELVQKADFAFSINFIPTIAEQCIDKGMMYISWIVDCPHTVLFSSKVSNRNNYIFIFDYQLYCRMAEKDSQAHFFYLPLACAYEEFCNCIESAGKRAEDFRSDVSFVGRLYSDPEHALYDQIHTFSGYVRGYLESMMEIQHKFWGVDLFREAISEQVWRQILTSVKWDLGNDYQGHERETMLNILNQKLAQRERMEVCNRLADKFDFVIYTPDDTSFQPKLKNRGYVDYLKEMPLVFSGSKINLNITLRSISSGIPLRCLDILGCGGFLLTNYQAELGEYFNDGTHLVVYQDFEDMERKIQYFLEHEQERQRIAQNGFERVKELFSYDNQIGKIIAVLEGV